MNKKLKEGTIENIKMQHNKKLGKLFEDLRKLRHILLQRQKRPHFYNFLDVISIFSVLLVIIQNVLNMYSASYIRDENCFPDSNYTNFSNSTILLQNINSTFTVLKLDECGVRNNQIISYAQNDTILIIGVVNFYYN